MPVNNYEVSPIANTVRMMNTEEFMAHKASISRNGQSLPAVLWRGLLIDGRNRMKACNELGIALNVVELEPNLTEKEAMLYADTMEDKRHLSLTERLIRALDVQDRVGLSVGETVIQCGVTRAMLTKARYVATHHNELIEPMRQGNSVSIHDMRYNKLVTVKAITAVHGILMNNAKIKVVSIEPTEEPDYKFVPSEHLDSLEGEAMYWDLVRGTDYEGIHKIICDYCNLVNK